MSPSQVQTGETRPCAYCGKPVPAHIKQCPYCREMIPEVRLSRSAGSDGRREIRHGLLYMLLAGVIYYFVGGYSAIHLPFATNPMVTAYLSPLLFLGGLGLGLYGVYLRMRS